MKTYYFTFLFFLIFLCRSHPKGETATTSIAFHLFEPDSLSNLYIEGFNTDYAYRLGKKYLVVGYYEPVDGEIVPTDSEKDHGYRLLFLNRDKEIEYMSPGAGDVYLYEPYFYQNETNDRTIVVCQRAFEYYFGGDAFLIERDFIRYIGDLDIESSTIEESLTDILKIEEVNGSIVFSFDADSLLLKPGDEDILVKNNDIRYEYRNDTLKLINSISLFEFTDSIGQVGDVVLLDKAFWEEHGLERLEKFRAEADVAYMLYNILETADYILWMIERDYSEEQIHWGVLFDREGNYLGFKEIAYDNSEGFLRKYTRFEGDKISIYSENIYENEGALSYRSYRMSGTGFHDASVGQSDTLMLKECLTKTLGKSLYIGQNYEGETIKEQTVFSDLANLLRQGARISEEELMLLFARDGGGWSTVTHPVILQLVLDSYLEGSDSCEDKAYRLNQMLLEAILISDPGITAVLMENGANPKHKDIWESLLHITLDYFPSYETMRLLVDRLDFDLYPWCDVTPIWWLVYERNAVPERRNSQILMEEMNKRKADADLVCNKKRGGGYFLDPEIFPADKNAWELAEYFGDREVLEYRNRK